MRQKWFERSIVLLLLVCMLAQHSIVSFGVDDVIPDGALTAEPETAVASETDAAPLSQDAEILYEIVEKRDEVTKHFAMSDGTTKALIYPQNVNYLSNGVYEEIDNTLVEFEQNGKTYYKNKKNGFQVKIPKHFTDDFIEFADENGYVKFRLLGATNKEIEKIAKKNNSNKKDITIAQNVNEKAVFKAIKGNVDLEYDLAGNKLKETIVLYKKTKNDFVFEIRTDSEKAILNNDKSVSFFNADGIEIYKMESPYMTDAAGEYSNEIEVKLSKEADGYQLSYSPNYEWLSEKHRTYPVRIDPTLVQAIYTGTVKDTYVSSVQTASNPDIRGGWDVLNIGRRTQTASGAQLIKRGFIYFEIPSEIGKNDCIVDAKLDLVHYTVPAAVSVNGIQIDVHELTSSFTEGGTWWGAQPYYDPIITEYALVNTGNMFSGSTLSYDSYNLTKLVSKWHNGAQNYGIMLKLHDEDVAVSSSKQVYYFAKQSQYYKSVSKFVEITYRNTAGLEDYWSYTTQDVGQYGAGYVNNYNGNLIYMHEDTGSNSLINGFTLSHVYNSCNVDSGNTLHSNRKYSAGWNLNLVQRLIPVNVTGNSSVKYKYIDGDGTEHYFVQLENGSIVDEDGLGYTFGTISEGELTYTITTKDKTVLKFDLWYFLRRIIDKNGNTINLNYSPGAVSSEDNHLASITTSSGGAYGLRYDENYRLYQIDDYAGRSISYSYSDAGNLNRISYPDGTYLTFEYENNRLTKINTPGGKSLNYTWNNGKVTNTCIKDNSNTTGQTIDFSYQQNQTTVTIPENKTITYQFDSWGRPTCVYDNFQNIYSQTYTEKVTSGEGIRSNNKLKTSSNEAVYVNNLLVNAVFANNLDNWNTYSENANAQCNVVSDSGLITRKSVKIESEIESTELITQVPSLTGAQTYTLSGYLKTSNVQSLAHGAGIEIVTNTNRVIYSDFVTGTTNAEINNGFQKVDVTVSLHEGESISRISAGLYQAAGTVYIDSLQLEEGDTANQINLIDNSSFERNNGSYTSPISYESNLGNFTDSGISTAVSKSGSASCMIGGTGTLTRSMNQLLPVSGGAGDTYIAGAWVKADAVPNHKADKENDADFTMHVFTYNGDTIAEHILIRFNEYISDWQYVSKAFTLKESYDRIRVYCSYDFNCNAAYFDNLFLYRDTMQSYTYDNNGNVISTVDYASQNSAFQYNNDVLSRLINPIGTGYEYLYDDKQNVTGAKSSEGIGYDVVYDSQGNVVSTSTSKHSYANTIQSGKTYYIRSKADGKYLAVPDGATANSTKIIKSDYLEWDYLKWEVESTNDGYYTITPKHVTTMALDIEGAYNDENTNVQIYIKNNTSAQKFKIVPQADYTYKIIPQSSPDGKVVTGTGNVTITSAQEAQRSYQEWYFDEVELEQSVQDGIYKLRVRHSGGYMDIASVQEGANVIHNQYNHTANTQKFIIKNYNNGDYYTISPIEAPQLYLEVSNISDDFRREEILLGNSEITDAKLFRFSYNNNIGAWEIITKVDEIKCLDVLERSVADNTNIVSNWNIATLNQAFLLERVSESITSSATYQDNGNYLQSVTDSRGNTTTYSYDTHRGLQTGVTDAKGTVTTYSYNGLNNRLESVTTGTSSVSYQYETDGTLKNITSPNGTVYNFTYDTFGRTKQILVGNVILSETTYENLYSSLVKRFDYGNGVYKTYEYDSQDRLISESTNGVTSRTYVYDKSGNVAQIHDLIANLFVKTQYDLIGRTIGMKSSDGQAMQFVYDKYNRVSLVEWCMGNMSIGTAYIYGDNAIVGQKTGLIYGVEVNGTQKIGYTYDDLTRLQKRTLLTETPYVTEYTYLSGADAGKTTSLVETIKNDNDMYTYTYDAVGNITSIKKNETVVKQYTYDSLNQLASATYGGNTYTYTYDNSGNITDVKKDGTTIKSYDYSNNNWKDLMTGYNGETITYDEIGNPLTYRNGMSFTWQNGRQLATIMQNGITLATYSYDADGLRTSKVVNGVTTSYYRMNGTIYAQKTGDESLYFLYDENGTAYGFILKNETTEQTYYYEFNLQGDIIGVVDNTGSKVVEYSYGAWGELLSITGSMADTIGQKNPLRYRGYYYDAESGLYYLNSRYYDPEVGRFINADNIVSGSGQSVKGYNLFAYCFNNPINMDDSNGNWPNFIRNIGDKIKSTIDASMKSVKKIKNALLDTCGISLNADIEKASSVNYYWIVTTETGDGYNKSFDNGKPLNFYKTLTNNPFNFWDGGNGVDVNINGYGMGVQKGNETSITIHLKNFSIDLGKNKLERYFIKGSWIDESGLYSYSKISINGPELGATVLGLIYLGNVVRVGAVAFAL